MNHAIEQPSAEPVLKTALHDAPDGELRYAGHEPYALSFHENAIPAFVAAELDRLYESLTSSLDYLRIYDKLSPDTSTFIARKDGEIVAVFLFRREGNAVRVLNEGIRVSAKDVASFAAAIFGKYQSVELITFQSVVHDVTALPFPFQSADCPGDVVLSLPAAPDDFLPSVGKQTRWHIRRDHKVLKKDYPDLDVRFYDGHEADPDQIRKIMALNKARMEELGEVYMLRSEADVARVVELAKTRGFMCVATIGGEVCFGTINILVGRTCIGRIMSHDSRYNSYGPGLLVMYFTICESIARGCRSFNFMDGLTLTKRRLGGKLQPQAHLVIYRSRWWRLRHAPTDLKFKWKHFALHAGTAAHEWIRQMEYKNTRAGQELNVGGKALLKSLKMLRWMRNMASHLLAGKR